MSGPALILALALGAATPAQAGDAPMATAPAASVVAPSAGAPTPPPATTAPGPSAGPAPNPAAQPAPDAGADPDAAAPVEAAPSEPLADGSDGSTVQAAYQAAENRQGPMDGQWRLSDADGAPLYDFMLFDTGGARSSRASNPEHPQIEGAWRDLRRERGPSASGFLDGVRRDGARLEIRFREPGRDSPQVLDLAPAPRGEWTGEFKEDGEAKTVFLARP